MGRVRVLVLTLGMVLTVMVVTSPSSTGKAKKRPDLVVAQLAVSPAKVPAGGVLKIADTTRNKGRKAAKRSVTSYFLSKNKRRDRSDISIASRKVAKLKPGQRDRRKKSPVRVPARTAPGAYWLLACADARSKVRESNERNNCRVAKRRVRITQKGVDWPRNGQVEVRVRADVDHREWASHDHEGMVEHEEWNVDLDGHATGWLIFAGGKPHTFAWTWSGVTASGSAKYDGQGPWTGPGCDLWTGEAQLARNGFAMDTSNAGGIAWFRAPEGPELELGLDEVLGEQEIPRMVCGQREGSIQPGLRLRVRGYFWSTPAELDLKWNAKRSTLTYHKRQTIHDPTYTEQGWEQQGTLRLTPVR